ncbi:MAG: DUF1028 domain-containing protein [Pseudomonadota bacterium]|uniref:Putative Ntn-hydrolase superfamily protein n=1 Tax=Actibacterium naphthalenivorans TaxID=1614693 RepID=A0A840CDP1_9RHOB|nr:MULTISPECIES: DUF1028 domain-containing protein [Actibacterium]ALG89435.1 major pilin protein fimA [Actibacterium sp. EMB200-NS6]MBB4020936.1 putative Ntn-hydrolase superfamily protein [Actibacterium naphthalenivorans]MDY6857731.1 DUF1028 domain-containing protein [Pseudomonadota bacterium]
MTFSILAFDEETGICGGAAATGSLCVGGWVLRGDSRSGMSASQGTSPSTLWGEDVLEHMRNGKSARAAVDAVVGPDGGRAHRQLAALDLAGTTAVFTGCDSIAEAGQRQGPKVVVSGNMLKTPAVLDAMLDGYLSATGAFATRLLRALEAGHAAGSDSRGLLSAALLVVGRDMAPLSLRIDWSETPVPALWQLYHKSQASPYADWLQAVPTRNDPHRSEM